MNREGFIEGLSTKNKGFHLDNEEAVRNIMIDIITEEYGKDTDTIRLLKCNPASKRLCTIALNRLKLKGLDILTSDNIEDAKKIIKGYYIGDAPRIEFGKDKIWYSFDEPDYIGRDREVYNGFHVYKNGENEYIFINEKYEIFSYGGPSYKLTRIFNDSGLQTAEICSLGYGEPGEEGYILKKPEIKELRDLYTLQYIRCDGKIAVGEDGSIRFNEKDKVDDYIIYIPKTTEDPCFIPEIEGVRAGTIADDIKVIPTNEDIALKFKEDCKNSQDFRNLPEFKKLNQEAR